MKNTELHNLKLALKKCLELETGIVTDKVHIAACAAERIALEADLDLADRRALARVAQLQVLASLAPQRTEAQYALLQTARQELVTAGHEFIRKQLRPRCLKLHQRAEQQVRQTLETQFGNANDLNRAVSASEVMNALRKIEAQAIIGGTGTDGCQARALKIIQAWNDADKFEQAHLN